MAKLTQSVSAVSWTEISLTAGTNYQIQYMSGNSLAILCEADSLPSDSDYKGFVLKPGEGALICPSENIYVRSSDTSPVVIIYQEI